MLSDDNTNRDGRGQLCPNAGFVGSVARHLLNTPCLVLDIDVLERNVDAMADYAQAVGVALRPHAKCHKSSDLARRQIAAGGVGVCCATIGEAEAMGWAGVGDILITSPLVTKAKMARFGDLGRIVGRLAVVVDNLANAEALSELALLHDQTFDVVIDIDPGMHRTGIPYETAGEFVSLVAAMPGLNYRGIQYYAGHFQHIQEYAERREQVLSSLSKLKQVVADLIARELEPSLITGSGTGTFDIDVGADIFTELQVGSYVFMDSQYWQLDHQGSRPNFEQSLFVQAAVCSVNYTEFVTVDAGLKHFSLDAGLPEIVGSKQGDAPYVFLGDEHGRVTSPAGGESYRLGDRVEFVPPHCDPTINLYNHIHCFRGDRLVEIWPIDARGK